MSDIALYADGLGKRYKIGVKQQKFPTLRDSLRERGRRMFKRRIQSDEAALWALRDVSFEIKRGSVTGVIGRNGAGKSTLLKILSRITDPSEGFAEIRGRVGSLLEVGTGFHPELTGRENIFLNGAILGMRRSEILRKFDQIIAFAEIERFLDTPVKHYSSGMFMRLAFSVAAHLDPEILLVDEVLAVGDAEFQKKCLGKMNSVASEGRTVLFVSHNMSAVQSLCSHCIFLQGGRVKVNGDISEGIRLYHEAGRITPVEAKHHEVVVGNLWVNGDASPVLNNLDPARFEFDVALGEPLDGYRMILILENHQGTIVFHAVRTEKEIPQIGAAGSYHVSFQMPPMRLTPGIYSFYVKFLHYGAKGNGRHISDRSLLSVEGEYDPTADPGIISPTTDWDVELRVVSGSEAEIPVAAGS